MNQFVASQRKFALAPTLLAQPNADFRYDATKDICECPGRRRHHQAC